MSCFKNKRFNCGGWIVGEGLSLDELWGMNCPETFSTLLSLSSRSLLIVFFIYSSFLFWGTRRSSSAVELLSGNDINPMSSLSLYPATSVFCRLLLISVCFGGEILSNFSKLELKTAAFNSKHYIVVLPGKLYRPVCFRTEVPEQWNPLPHSLLMIGGSLSASIQRLPGVGILHDMLVWTFSVGTHHHSASARYSTKQWTYR